MVTVYPAQIDTASSLPLVVDGQTPVNATLLNSLRGAILAIEQALGVNPANGYTTVTARLSNIEAVIGNLPIVSLSQDLGGTLSNPLVIGIQGRPVIDTQPLMNQALGWNGSAWAPMPVQSNINFAQDLTGNASLQTVIGIQNRAVANTSPSAGQTYIWTGTNWAPSSNFGSQNIATTGSFTSNQITTIGSTAPAVSNAGQGSIYFDNSQDKFLVSQNASSYVSFLTSGSTAGGDLSGTLPSPTVIQLQGHPVSSSSPTTNYALVYSGSQYQTALLPATSSSYAPATGSIWQYQTPLTLANVADQLANSTAQGFIYVRQFCPPSLLSSFANLSGLAIAPPMLVNLFANLAAAQAAFPHTTNAGWMTSGAFASNSLDWACIQEAVSYVESTPSLRTVWFGEGAYGVAGTITMNQGTALRGQGSMGSSQRTGTGITHFSNSDLFIWQPLSSVLTVNNDATGGGVYHMSLWKANRNGVSGLSYGNGSAIHTVASNVNHRAGEFVVFDVLVAAEGGLPPAATVTWEPSAIHGTNAYVMPFNGYYYKNEGSTGMSGTDITVFNGVTTIGQTVLDGTITWTCFGAVGTWAHAYYGDSSACTVPNSQGVRSHWFFKFRCGAAGNPAATSVLFDTCNHIHGAIQVDAGNIPEGTSGMTIQGNCQDIQLRLEVESDLIIKANGTIGSVPYCAIQSVSATNPATIVVSPALPFGSGNNSPTANTAAINITGADGTANINGLWTATFTTPGDTTTFTIPVDGTGYTSDGYVQSAGPTQLTIDGKIGTVVVYNNDSSGLINQTTDIISLAGASPYFVNPTSEFALSYSPLIRFNGPQSPAFQFQLFNVTSGTLFDGYTGSGSPITLMWNQLNFDSNFDLRGQSSPYQVFPCHVAGRYRFRARVLMANLGSTNTYAVLQLNQVFATGGHQAFTTRQNIITTTEGTYQTIEIEEVCLMNYQDYMEVILTVYGASSPLVVAYADSGDGFTFFSGELI